PAPPGLPAPAVDSLPLPADLLASPVPGSAGEGMSPEGAPTSPSTPNPEKRKYRLDASWTNGLQFTSDDQQFHVHVGANAMIDSTWLIAPKGAFAIPGGGANGVENASATFVRRGRLRIEGDIFDQFDFIVEYDLANADNDNSGLQPPSFGNLNAAPAACNVWMQIRDVPVLGNVRFGNQVKPIGMTNNTYQGFLPFIERADNMDAFYGPFDKGFALA